MFPLGLEPIRERPDRPKFYSTTNKWSIKINKLDVILRAVVLHLFHHAPACGWNTNLPLTYLNNIVSKKKLKVLKNYKTDASFLFIHHKYDKNVDILRLLQYVSNILSNFHLRVAAFHQSRLFFKT